MTSKPEFETQRGVLLPGRKGKHRKRHRARWIALTLVAVMIYPVVTFVQALTYPGAATLAARTSDWARGIGAGQVVNMAENWWYTRHAPANTLPDTGSLPSAQQVAQPAATGPADLQASGSALPGEGIWIPGARTADGRIADYTTYLRADPQHASVVAGIAMLDQGVVSTQLVAGTKEPGGSGWPGGAQVPQSLRSSLLATFNSGFKLADTSGGFYLGGRMAKPLKDGIASLVIDSSGTVSVGQWGRDVTMGPNIAAVRQNLELVVDNGKPVAGLAGNPAGQWGSASNQFQFTWRSGIGTDSAGHLIYVGGAQLTLTTLADVMARAGIVRGMELDIHTGMVTFNTYRPDQPGTSPAKLLPSMPSPADRYLAPDQRDFFAVTLRAKAAPGSVQQQ
ncbi:MAG: hypothetical protein QOI21_2346 [Actinomycetota bacterium]|jgi:hypothetical protein|nr:hypothetical protein [Actinomycetota bacterium]